MALGPEYEEVEHGRPWLDEARISQAIAALTRVSATSLLEANQKATDLLLNGTTVEGLSGWDGGPGSADPLHRLGELGQAARQRLRRGLAVPRRHPRYPGP
jgi:hypothetical protein